MLLMEVMSLPPERMVPMVEAVSPLVAPMPRLVLVAPVFPRSE